MSYDIYEGSKEEAEVIKTFENDVASHLATTVAVNANDPTKMIETVIDVLRTFGWDVK